MKYSVSIKLWYVEGVIFLQRLSNVWLYESSVLNLSFSIPVTTLSSDSPITSVPTFIFLRSGKQLDKYVGIDKNKFKKKIKKYIN